MVKYCQDKECPNDAFVNCVEETTKVSFLAQDSCTAQDSNHRAFIQAKLAVFGPDCENMCKKMGIYPNCQCPGFEGQPATDGDSRLCYDKLCQDPSTPCPSDAFVTCVK